MCDELKPTPSTSGASDLTSLQQTVAALQQQLATQQQQHQQERLQQAEQFRAQMAGAEQNYATLGAQLAAATQQLQQLVQPVTAPHPALPSQEELDKASAAAQEKKRAELACAKQGLNVAGGVMAGDGHTGQCY